MPFAVRSLRCASGAVIDGITFPHVGWLSVDEITPAIEIGLQMIPGDPVTKPLLEVVEYECAADPVLRGWDISGAPLPEVGDDKPADINKDGVIDDLEAKTKQMLLEQAKALGLAVTPAMNKAALIDAIRAAAKPAEPASSTEPVAVGASTEPATEAGQSATDTQSATE